MSAFYTDFYCINKAYVRQKLETRASIIQTMANFLLLKLALVVLILLNKSLLHSKVTGKTCQIHIAWLYILSKHLNINPCRCNKCTELAKIKILLFAEDYGLSTLKVCIFVSKLILTSDSFGISL